MTLMPSTDPDAQPAEMDIKEFVAHIHQLARHKGANGEELPVATGTFAIYAMEDGGIMVVSSMGSGPMAGTHHQRVSPRMIRALAAFAGGSKTRAIKELMGGKS